MPPAQDAAFRQAATEVQANFDRSSGGNGTYTFTMKPNIQLTLREEAVVQARQTIERRVNELGVTEPSIAQQGTNGDQILVQLPGVTDVDRAKEIIRSHRAARAEDRRAGTGGVARGAARQRPGAGGHGDRAGRRAATPATRANTVYYLVRKAAAVSGRDLRNARPHARREQPAGGQLHAELRRRPQVRQGHRREHRPAARDHPRRPRAVGADASTARITTDGRITGSFTQEEVQNLSLILRSGALPATLTYLEERTIGPSLGADSIRSGVIGVGGRPAARRRLHAGLLQAVGRERGRRADVQPRSSCSA